MKLVPILLFGALSATAAQKETMRVTVAKSLLQTGMQSSLNEKRPVTGKLMDSDVQGNAVTTGQLKIDLVPNAEAAAFSIHALTDTESHTVGTNHPRHGISVDVRSTAYTSLDSTQTLLLRPEGLAADPAVIHVGKSSIYYEGLDVHADGALSDVTKISTEQEAWQRIWKLKAHNEDLTARRVESEMRSTLQQQIDSFNHFYQTIFYQPVFSQSGQNRSLHFSTTADALTSTIVSDAPDTLTPAPEFDGGNVLALRIHDSLASHYFAESVEAKDYNEEDLEEFFILHGIPSGLGKYRDGEAQVHLTFCPQQPISVQFETLQIGFTVCARELSFGDQKATDVKLTMTYTSRLNPDGSVDLVRLEDPALDGASKLTPATQTELQKRFARIFPEQVTIPKVRLAGQFGSQGDLVTHRADLGDGWLVTELWFDPASQKTQGAKQ